MMSQASPRILPSVINVTMPIDRMSPLSGKALVEAGHSFSRDILIPYRGVLLSGRVIRLAP